MKYIDTAKNYKNKLRGFDKYPAAADRASYDGLPAKLKDEIISEGEKYLGFQFPALSATDYMSFLRTGNRTDFEAVYFEKRHALCALVLAECVEYNGRFVDDIINGVFSICEETGWQLPAHNTYIRDTPQLILPDLCKPIIDLFAAETGALLAWISYLLGERLDEISPIIRKRIRHELNNRIFIPYTTCHFWWMGNGDEKMCNWTAWCTQNVLLAAFLTLGITDYNTDEYNGSTDNAANDIYDGNSSNVHSGDEARLNKIFRQAAESCDCFLKDYGEDGCCDEGAQYYRHAGLCLFGALDILNYISYGAFDEHFNETRLKNIASYILNVHVSDEYYFNFSDCAAKPGRCGVREYLFGKSVNEPALCKLAASDFCAENGRLYTGANDQINLFYMLMTCFNYDEIISFNQNNQSDNNVSDNNITSDSESRINDIYYKSVGLFISRNDTLSLAVKAGNNDDNHNHNDTGSFIIYKNGIPLFVDIGVESYTQKTFSDKRYEIWTMQSCYHNLPTINEKDELSGKKYLAADVEYSFSENGAGISMELITAYPIEQCSYKRAIFFNKKDNSIVLNDTTDCNTAVLNFILYEKPDIFPNEFLIGNHTKCTYSGAELLDLEALQIKDKRLMQSWDHELYRLRFRLNKSSAGNERSFILKIN